MCGSRIHQYSKHRRTHFCTLLFVVGVWYTNLDRVSQRETELHFFLQPIYLFQVKAWIEGGELVHSCAKQQQFARLSKRDVPTLRAHAHWEGNPISLDIMWCLSCTEPSYIIFHFSLSRSFSLALALSRLFGIAICQCSVFVVCCCCYSYFAKKRDSSSSDLSLSALLILFPPFMGLFCL